MVPQIEHLSAEERETLLQAFPQVAVLVAVADGEIDRQEKIWSKKISDMRTYSSHETLQPFYQKLDTSFSARFEALVKTAERNPEGIQASLTEALKKLNDILPKIEETWAARYYKDLLSYAKHIAKASGGFFRIGAINKEEYKVVDLPMVHPIIVEGLDNDPTAHWEEWNENESKEEQEGE